MLNNAGLSREGIVLGAHEILPLPQLSGTSTLGWDEGTESTLTPPSEEFAAANVTSPTKLHRQCRIGWPGICDMLRMPKRSQTLANARPTRLVGHGQATDGVQPRTTLSTGSSTDAHGNMQG